MVIMPCHCNGVHKSKSERKGFMEVMRTLHFITQSEIRGKPAASDVVEKLFGSLVFVVGVGAGWAPGAFKTNVIS